MRGIIIAGIALAMALPAAAQPPPPGPQPTLPPVVLFRLRVARAARHQAHRGLQGRQRVAVRRQHARGCPQPRHQDRACRRTARGAERGRLVRLPQEPPGHRPVYGPLDFYLGLTAVDLDGYRVAWAVQEGSDNVLYATRPGDGTPVRFNPAGTSVDSLHQAPDLVAGPQGELYLTWSSRRPVPTGGLFASDLRLSRSLDGGKTWDSHVRDNEDTPTSHSFEGLALTPDGTVIVAWIETRDGKAATFVARVGERGTLWATPCAWTPARHVSAAVSTSPPGRASVCRCCGGRSRKARRVVPTCSSRRGRRDAGSRRRGDCTRRRARSPIRRAWPSTRAGAESLCGKISPRCDAES